MISPLQGKKPESDDRIHSQPNDNSHQPFPQAKSHNRNTIDKTPIDDRSWLSNQQSEIFLLEEERHRQIMLENKKRLKKLSEIDKDLEQKQFEREQKILSQRRQLQRRNYIVNLKRTAHDVIEKKKTGDPSPSRNIQMPSIPLKPSTKFVERLRQARHKTKRQTDLNRSYLPRIDSGSHSSRDHIRPDGNLSAMDTDLNRYESSDDEHKPHFGKSFQNGKQASQNQANVRILDEISRSPRSSNNKKKLSFSEKEDPSSRRSKSSETLKKEINAAKSPVESRLGSGHTTPDRVFKKVKDSRTSSVDSPPGILKNTEKVRFKEPVKTLDVDKELKDSIERDEFFREAHVKAFKKNKRLSKDEEDSMAYFNWAVSVKEEDFYKKLSKETGHPENKRIVIPEQESSTSIQTFGEDPGYQHYSPTRIENTPPQKSHRRKDSSEYDEEEENDNMERLEDNTMYSSKPVRIMTNISTNNNPSSSKSKREPKSTQNHSEAGYISSNSQNMFNPSIHISVRDNLSPIPLSHADSNYEEQLKNELRHLNILELQLQNELINIHTTQDSKIREVETRHNINPHANSTHEINQKYQLLLDDLSTKYYSKFKHLAPIQEELTQPHSKASRYDGPSDIELYKRSEHSTQENFDSQKPTPKKRLKNLEKQKLTYQPFVPASQMATNLTSQSDTPHLQNFERNIVKSNGSRDGQEIALAKNRKFNENYNSPGQYSQNSIPVVRNPNTRVSVTLESEFPPDPNFQPRRNQVSVRSTNVSTQNLPPPNVRTLKIPSQRNLNQSFSQNRDQSPQEIRVGANSALNNSFAHPVRPTYGPNYNMNYHASLNYPPQAYPIVGYQTGYPEDPFTMPYPVPSVSGNYFGASTGIPDLRPLRFSHIFDAHQMYHGSMGNQNYITNMNQNFMPAINSLNVDVRTNNEYIANKSSSLTQDNSSNLGMNNALFQDLHFSKKTGYVAQQYKKKLHSQKNHVKVPGLNRNMKKNGDVSIREVEEENGRSI